MLELKLFGNHEGKDVSSQLHFVLLEWAINRLLITLLVADEEAEW